MPLSTSAASYRNIAVSTLHAVTHHGATSAPLAAQLVVSPLYVTTHHGATSAPSVARLAVSPLHASTHHGATSATLAGSLAVSPLYATTIMVPYQHLPQQASWFHPLTLQVYCQTREILPSRYEKLPKSSQRCKRGLSSPNSTMKCTRSPKED